MPTRMGNGHGRVYAYTPMVETEQLSEIFVLVRMDAPVVAELRALGVRVHFRAEIGEIGMSTVIEVAPNLSEQLDGVLTRHGLRELREGVWGDPETNADSIRQWEKSARSTAEYTDIYRTMAEHPDWSDQEVAESCGANVEDVTYYRSEWDVDPKP